MSTASPSYSHPEIPQPDLQVALMKTEKGAILRMATGFTQPVPHRGHHWYAVMGTRGCVEWKRAERDFPKLWLANAQMHDMAYVDWRFEREDAPPEARGSGHGGEGGRRHRENLQKSPHHDSSEGFRTSYAALAVRGTPEAGRKPVGGRRGSRRCRGYHPAR